MESRIRPSAGVKERNTPKPDVIIFFFFLLCQKQALSWVKKRREE